MIRANQAILILLAGCAAKQPLPLPPPPVVIEVTPKPAKPVVPKPVASVAQQYRKAAQKELQAVMSPRATHDSVRSVHQADVEARQALEVLEKQGRHPTAEALSQARAAVGNLAATLNNAP